MSDGSNFQYMPDPYLADVVRVVNRVRWLMQGYEQTARMDSDAKVPLALVAAQIRACLDGDGDE